MTLDHDLDDELRLAVARAFMQYATDELLRLLTDDNPIVRTAAARELHLRGGDLAYVAAKRLANSSLPAHREVAAFLLGQLGTPECPFASESFPILLGLMKDTDSEVSYVAVGAIGSLASLGKRPPDDVLSAILEFASRPNAHARLAAADALGCIHEPAARDALARLAEDPDADVAETAKFWLEP